jgi:hypothetical protein
MLVILATHAIQYEVPIWKALAARGKVADALANAAANLPDAAALRAHIARFDYMRTVETVDALHAVAMHRCVALAA